MLKFDNLLKILLKIINCWAGIENLHSSWQRADDVYNFQLKLDIFQFKLGAPLYKSNAFEIKLYIFHIKMSFFHIELETLQKY